LLRRVERRANLSDYGKTFGRDNRIVSPMTSPPKEAEAEHEKELVDVSGNIVFAQFFTFSGVLLAPVCLLGGVQGTWVWYAAAAVLLGGSLLSAIHWWRLLRRKKELQDRGVKLPDFGKPPELEGIERILRE
jgi:hypothetical protein